jgi:hypothetical protein
LGQGQSSPDALTALQKLLEDEDQSPSYLQAIRGERASLHEMVGAIESGQLTIAQAEGSKPFLGEGVVEAIWRPGFKSEHADILEMMTRHIDAIRLSPQDQIAAETSIEAEIRALPRTRILTRLMSPAVSRINESCRRQHVYVRSLIACLAAERYRQKHGTWPATVADLAPSELSAVPQDPFDGQPLRMRRLPDGVVIYSVGRDMIDDGGNLAKADEVMKTGFDLGFRLWDPGHRARPASADGDKKP